MSRKTWDTLIQNALVFDGTGETPPGRWTSPSRKAECRRQGDVPAALHGGRSDRREGQVA